MKWKIFKAWCGEGGRLAGFGAEDHPEASHMTFPESFWERGTIVKEGGGRNVTKQKKTCSKEYNKIDDLNIKHQNLIICL